MDASPVKRRVLGTLDPNACSPKPKPNNNKHDVSAFKVMGQSPVKAKAVAPQQAVQSPTRVFEERLEQPESRKRRSPTPKSTPASTLDGPVGEGDGEPAAKRPCLDGAREESLGQRAEPSPKSPPSSTSTTRTAASTTRHRSASPDTSSLFDHSAVDNSQATILTEPDTSAPAPAAAATATSAPRPRVRLTREQAKQKAEILRLRLGLASYKVRTGQTDVPLDRLEARQVDRSRGLAAARAAAVSQGHGQHGQNQQDGSSSSQGSNSFPPTRAAATSTSSSTSSFAAAGRRPLPGAPAPARARSGSSVSFVEQSDVARAVASLRQGLGAALDERRQLQQQQRQHQHPATHQHHHYHHQRRQSEVLTGRTDAARRYQDAGMPPRPRTATEGVAPAPASSLSRGRSLVVVEDEDLEGRGGAASGLLSLARS